MFSFWKVEMTNRVRCFDTNEPENQDLSEARPDLSDPQDQITQRFDRHESAQ
jgi:hypothetical protein